MLARVRESSVLKVITACSGINFVKHEWYEVPVGREEEALNNPYLEVRLETLPSLMEAGQVEQVSDLTGVEEASPVLPVPASRTRHKKAGA